VCVDTYWPTCLGKSNSRLVTSLVTGTSNYTNVNPALGSEEERVCLWLQSKESFLREVVYV